MRSCRAFKDEDDEDVLDKRFKASGEISTISEETLPASARARDCPSSFFETVNDFDV